MLFVSSQQICKCGSKNCRGVVGGRGQRLNGQVKDKSTRRTGKPSKEKHKGKQKVKHRVSKGCDA